MSDSANLYRSMKNVVHTPNGDIHVETLYIPGRGQVNNITGTQYNYTRNGVTTSYVVPENENTSSICENKDDGVAGPKSNESLSSSDDHYSFPSWKWKKFRGKQQLKNNKLSKKGKISTSSLSSDANPPRDLDIDMLDTCGEIRDQVKGISGDLKEISSLVSQEMRGIQSRNGVHEKGGNDSSGSVDGALSDGVLWPLYERMIEASREMYDLSQTLGYIQWERDAKDHQLPEGGQRKM